MNLITNQLARLAALFFGGFLISSCILPPPMPSGPPDESAAPPNQPGPTADTPPADSGTPAPAPDGPRQEEYPVAKPTHNPDQVISPYEPYNVIDVSGYHSGQMVRDPSNRKIFRIP